MTEASHCENRPGGNYTQPEYVYPKGYEYVAFAGWVEIGRFPSHQEAEHAVKDELERTKAK